MLRMTSSVSPRVSINTPSVAESRQDTRNARAAAVAPANLLIQATAITATMNGDSLKKLLFAGLTYANIHTTQNGGGEIRGQIARQ